MTRLRLPTLFLLLSVAVLPVAAAVPGWLTIDYAEIVDRSRRGRGVAAFAGFAPTKAAQRVLAESMARELGPKGVHVAYVAIDAVIDLEWTRKRMPDKPDDFFCKPVDIAEECYRIAHQPKSAWSFTSIIRPFGENWSLNQ